MTTFMETFQQWSILLDLPHHHVKEEQLHQRLKKHHLDANLFGVLYLIATIQLTLEGIDCERVAHSLALTIALMVGDTLKLIRMPPRQFPQPKVSFNKTFIAGMIAERMILTYHQRQQETINEST
jgi:hypothetical protein